MPTQLIKLAIAHSEVEANVWRSALEQDGVAVLIRNTDPLSSVAAAPMPGASFDFFVSSRDEKRARWLLGLPDTDSYTGE